MNTRHISTRLVLSAALAAGIFFASAPMQAQAPALSGDQNQRAKITSLQAQVNVLQAQVNALQAQIKRLQAEVHVLAPRRGVTPIDHLPPVQLPNLQGQGGFGGGDGFGGGGNFGPSRQFLPYPGIPQDPGIQGYLFQAPQSQQPQVTGPQPYWNIPPCTITLINQKTH